MAIDMSLAKAPPKRAATVTRTRATVQSVNTLSPNEKRRDGLLGLAQLGQGICLMFGLYADAATIGRHFPPVATELANVADSYDVVAKPIDVMIEIGPFGALVAAAIPLVTQVMANHKLIDANKMAGQGVVPPEVLEAQMKAEVARMQAEAMRAQQEAMVQAKKAKDEYDAMLAEYDKVA